MAKLKVFQWSDGFHAWTVATSSRTKALAAWGFERDLFKDGSAREIEEGDDFDRAMAAPGELIERGLTVDIGEVTRAAKPSPRREPDTAARERLAGLERDLDALDAAQASETLAMKARRTALEAEMEVLSARQRKARKALLAKVKTARGKV